MTKHMSRCWFTEEYTNIEKKHRVYAHITYARHPEYCHCPGRSVVCTVGTTDTLELLRVMTVEV
jgi:hypothetical protein